MYLELYHYTFQKTTAHITHIHIKIIDNCPIKTYYIEKAKGAPDGKVYALCGDVHHDNNVTKKILEDTRANPEKYSNLMVKVWGYNDYFVSLDKDKQEHIISRTIHGEM
ncbi:MAG: hypothetical protein E7315_06285 [Clostridiales bacterium]|nr:hypothetical protein [Clostridiales bacterium]